MKNTYKGSKEEKEKLARTYFEENWNLHYGSGGFCQERQKRADEEKLEAVKQ